MKELFDVQSVIEKLFYVPNKSGEIVPFILNNIQKDFHDKRVRRSDILKFRQAGFTTFILAWFLVECLYGNSRCVMIAHDRDHSEKLLQRCHFILNTMNGPKPQLGKSNNQEITFPKVNSTFYIGTAGSRQFGRSDTITHLHCSEYAFWKDPQALTAGLLQAVPHDTGVVVKECTANGYGTYHHKQYMKASKGESKFKAFFYPWNHFLEYQSRTPLNTCLNDEELLIKKEFSLNNAQMQWRREKLEEFGGDLSLFQQEYPLTVTEAFRVSGGSLFPKVQQSKSSKWKESIPPLAIGRAKKHIDHPKKDCNYVIGSDIAGGTGNDYSTIQILCVETMEQVLSYATNTMAPPQFAQVICEYGKIYNMAYLVPEANQHGLSVIGCLKDMEPYASNKQLIYRMTPGTKTHAHGQPTSKSYGFWTTSTSKYKLIGLLQKHLEELTIYDELTVDELIGYGEVGIGQMGNIAASGHDDLVIALALAVEGLLRRLRFLAIEPRPIPKSNYQPDITVADMKERINVINKESWFGEQTKGASNDSFGFKQF